MKVLPTNYSKIGLYVWMLGRNLLVDKRNLRRMIKYNVSPNLLRHAEGATLESHNAFQRAKEYFAEDLVKVNSPEMKT